MKLEGNEKKEYLAFVRKESPKTEHAKTMTRAFFLGGIICCIGQGISDLLRYLAPTLEEKIIMSFTLLIIITITGILTGFGIYDKIGDWGGAGSIIPITGFANSIVSPAIERKTEGVVLGLCNNMFTIAGPVIVIGLTVSVLVGLIYWFIGVI
ncbi:MAG: SpoVA/SpoVAEb family sporulation membrane protein [Clostridiales bacterium]|nr:SpoVA/SpoVAEb family sporulation membrane protein [Clostridiales bacterium]